MATSIAKAISIAMAIRIAMAVSIAMAIAMVANHIAKDCSKLSKLKGYLTISAIKVDSTLLAKVQKKAEPSTEVAGTIEESRVLMCN